jgi:hypothetical protein
MDEPSQLVDKTTLRQMFNDGEYWERALYGDLYQAMVEDGHPRPGQSGEPFCTRSQLIAYMDGQGREVAFVHQYRRQDGSIGASGRPDPKQLFKDGVWYVIDEWS